jgi:hypothetical protein
MAPGGFVAPITFSTTNLNRVRGPLRGRRKICRRLGRPVAGRRAVPPPLARMHNGIYARLGHESRALRVIRPRMSTRLRG